MGVCRTSCVTRRNETSTMFSHRSGEYAAPSCQKNAALYNSLHEYLLCDRKFPISSTNGIWLHSAFSQFLEEM